MANPVTTTDYKAASIQGKQRIFGGKFENPMGGIPHVTFDEELITYDAITDTVFRNTTGGCQASLTDSTKELPLRSPVDDAAIDLATFITKLTTQGKVTNEDFFILFYSLGRRSQTARDAYNAAVKAQATAQVAYDASQTPDNLAALNNAIAATTAAIGAM